MAENKLQHYVPKCHLRPFASGEAVNLYNIGSGRLIEGAPIKGQCARNYFYGKDGGIERALQDIEGAYATAVAKAAENPSTINAGDFAVLREFALLQTFRTYGHVEKLMALAERQYADIKQAAAGRAIPLGLPESIEQVVFMSIRHFLEMREHVQDLEHCLIVNQSRLRFITSDDPAIHTNRYHIQKLRHDSFGFSSAGAMLFLPLTPTLAFLAFDPNVYVIPDRRGAVATVKRDSEVSAINELQILHARQNIYYGDAATGEIVEADFRRLSGGRPTVWTELMYFEKTGETEEGAKYDRVQSMNLDGRGDYMTFVQMAHVQPSQWPGLIRYRLRPRVVHTGTGAGTVRPDHPVLRGVGIPRPSFPL
ncbi:DUF4238 domain-containing protein [Sinorhizobium meliloti]|uniref:DUF4238 domain-containing protein n=1 Tax=Rhizobium meliloti TaxID=382 RepID=UPI000FD2FEFF|nr:DUF4238 domain-containing protein [Sinorhizobium meliloti]RVG83979.1 DUF4238 domain-containing protein [Sinorhizobium meliloti]RVN59227.1 DUF4238 domain-containing protein [Sinorhizobium meliloti]RVO20875.1 DUF4238 domain-containing protein [Sinorhizobium meliloti]RVO45102.1 DUF4238 domain-containing protein [Sinorhizobium meliloti]RVP85382.1 DUF4238 domain-containing protein [Sinorhizobium meliloti]